MYIELDDKNQIWRKRRKE